MMLIKKTLLLLTFLISFPVYALEKVECHDEFNRWSVEFQLDYNVLIGLTFVKNGEMVRQYSENLKAQTTWWFGKTIYETTLGPFAYFDFERRKVQPRFDAAFLLQNNPIGMETSVSCFATQI